jgi:hypothetical protein
MIKPVQEQPIRQAEATTAADFLPQRMTLPALKKAARVCRDALSIPEARKLHPNSTWPSKIDAANSQPHASSKKTSMSQHRFPTGNFHPVLRLRTGARKFLNHHPLGTGFGSTVGAAVVGVAAGAVGAGSVVVYTCLATGVVIGGWAGHSISQHRSKPTDAEVLRRRTRTIRLLKVTRMLRRRNVA